MKEIYEWADWFRELAKIVCEIGENGLIEKSKCVDWRSVNDGGTFKLINPQYGDQNIDPFSFFYTLAMRNTTNLRSIVYESVKEQFGIKTPLPPLELDEAWIFPTPGAHTNTLFHLNGNGNPSLMWKLFRDACKGFDSIKDTDFNSALQMKGVKRKKLTQTLLLINHESFAPFDDTMASIVPEITPEPFNFEKYRKVLENVRIKFPDCALKEINLYAFWRENILANSNRAFYQISTNIYDQNKSHWEEFDKSNWVMTGGPAAKEKPYNSLPKVKNGDVMLVRYGIEGRGIGIVHKNEYNEDFLDNWDDNARIHVVWINKSRGDLKTDAKQFPAAISRAHRLVDAWKESDAYAPTFRLISGPSDDNGKLYKSDKIPPSIPLSSRSFSVNHFRNRILYGPPGTGKTFHAVNHALAIIDDESLKFNDDQEYRTRFRDLRFDLNTKEGQIAMVTFHQNFAYEDFIEGIRPKLKGAEVAYELHDGIFKRIAHAAKDRADKRFVLIIDEINRGNIAKIFGELITLLEDSRRLGQDDATKVTLPYSVEEFGVPENLYIIGTMNTADRSIQLLDTALRRRFTFMEMMPNAKHHKINTDVDGVNCRNLVAAINKRIAALLDREHQIGHTYLFGVNSMEQLSFTFRNKIFPLLQEYFFDDWEKIRAVLGNNAFVQECPIEQLPGNLVDEEHKIYERLADNDSRWLNPSEYKLVYKGAQTSGTNGTESNS